MKILLHSLLTDKNIGFSSIKKIQGEASTREFYRITRTNAESLVGMIYPENAISQIKKIIRLTKTYRNYGLYVPDIKDVFADRVLLLEDLGDLLLQIAFAQCKYNSQVKEHYLETIVDIIIRLAAIPVECTDTVLDNARMKWEMDYFLAHFAPYYLNLNQEPGGIEPLKEHVYRIVDMISSNNTFAHRDFHSRNLLVADGKIGLVDFQDSLIAPPFYDLVSIAYDAYLDLKHLRSFFLERLQSRGMDIDEEQLYLTALQRNIKALGTFGFQVNVRKKLSYKKYIPRTIRHIRGNPLSARFSLSKYFPG